MAVIHRPPPGPSALSVAGRALRVALRRQCPQCGKGRIWKGWLTLADRCPVCGLVPNRGEPDYFIGAYLVNFILAETLPVLAFLGVMLVTWPDPPWDAMLWGAAALAVIAPVITYPITTTFWLAVDLAFRPPGAER